MKITTDIRIWEINEDPVSDRKLITSYQTGSVSIDLIFDGISVTVPLKELLLSVEYAERASDL